MTTLFHDIDTCSSNHIMCSSKNCIFDLPTSNRTSHYTVRERTGEGVGGGGSQSLTTKRD